MYEDRTNTVCNVSITTWGNESDWNRASHRVTLTGSCGFHLKSAHHGMAAIAVEQTILWPARLGLMVHLMLLSALISDSDL